jgi:CheY-like chemotaxis protein
VLVELVVFLLTQSIRNSFIFQAISAWISPVFLTTPVFSDYGVSGSFTRFLFPAGIGLTCDGRFFSKECRMPGKILIVDDEVHIRMLLEQTLEELEEDHGVTILSAQNGEEGLELIRKEKPDVVFLDIMMPKLNGYEVCQRVKEDGATRGCGIVLLTAKGQEVDRKQGLEMGATMYMTKPFDPDEVLKVARDLLGIPA